MICVLTFKTNQLVWILKLWLIIIHKIKYHLKGHEGHIRYHF